MATTSSTVALSGAIHGPLFRVREGIFPGMYVKDAFVLTLVVIPVAYCGVMCRHADSIRSTRPS
jgi:hypothetical protein